MGLLELNRYPLYLYSNKQQPAARPRPPRHAVPERIHPPWRATQLARGAARCLPTGHAALSAELPDGGWPMGSLVELLSPHPGVGEIRLLRPALSQLETRRPIALVQPARAQYRQLDELAAGSPAVALGLP